MQFVRERWFLNDDGIYSIVARDLGKHRNEEKIENWKTQQEKARESNIISISFDGKRTIISLKEEFVAVEIGDLIILLKKGSSSIKFFSPKEELKEEQEKRSVREKERELKAKTTQYNLENLEDKEFNVLNKVSLIPFSRRDLKSVLLELSSEERKILKSLATKGFFKFYEKAGKTFLSFDEKVYEKLKDLSKIRRESKENFISGDFMIISPAFVKKYLSEIDNSFVFTVDARGTLFAVKRAKAKQLYKKVESILKKGEQSLEDIANKLKLRREEALALLKLMAEEGLVYEPSRNRYSLA